MSLWQGEQVVHVLPLGRRVTYAYDNNGRLATVMDPEGGVTPYTYDAQGRMLTLMDARGAPISQTNATPPIA